MRAPSPAPPESGWPSRGRASGPLGRREPPPAAPAAPCHRGAHGCRPPPGACPRRGWQAGLGHHAPGRAHGSCGAHGRGGPTPVAPRVSLGLAAPRCDNGQPLPRSPLTDAASPRSARPCGATRTRDSGAAPGGPLPWQYAGRHRRATAQRWPGAKTAAGADSEAAGSQAGRCRSAYREGPRSVGPRGALGMGPTGQGGGSGSEAMGADALATGAYGCPLGTVRRCRGGANGRTPAWLRISWGGETGAVTARFSPVHAVFPLLQTARN
jgi:hypothetical protein